MAQLVRAPPCHGGGRGFESLPGRLYGIIAQLGEHLPYKQRVIGSSPIGPILIKYADVAQFVLIAREGNMKQSRLITNQLCKIFRRCGSIGRAADL